MEEFVSSHQRFSYTSIEALKDEIADLALDLPVSENTTVLVEPFALGNGTVPNRLVIQPMEGCDGTADGRPGELTLRRYERFAAGGAGLLWFEATAVVSEGRANPRQLWLTNDTVGDFKKMLEKSQAAAANRFGEDFRPYTVLQLTHSGRYSRPVDKPAPIIAAKNPWLAEKRPEPDTVISDDELEAIEDRYVEAAKLAGEAGFDAIDIKSCHRYLISELLSAHEREGKYGGSFENRTRFLLNIVDKVKAACPEGPAVTVRLNVYDAIPYPCGWGVDKDDHHIVDLSEPIRLARLLEKRGVDLLDITAGNPYYNPHVNRPYDSGPYAPPEHSLAGVARLMGIARDMQAALDKTAVIASGLSWLREYAAEVAAGCIEAGWFTFAGFGRQAFAYPDFAADIIHGEGMDRKKCCIACGKCSEIMRFGSTAGCVIRDAKVYVPVYKAASEGKDSIVSNHIAEHI